MNDHERSRHETAPGAARGAPLSGGLIAAFVGTALAPVAVYAVVTELKLAGRLSSVVGLGAAVVIALAAAILLTMATSRPLHRLAEAAAVIADGGQTRLLDVHRHDEIGRIAASFDDMTKQLARQTELLNARLRAISSDLIDVSTFGQSLAHSHDVRDDLAALAPRLTAVLGSDFVWIYLLKQGDLMLAAYSGPDDARRVKEIDALARQAMSGALARGGYLASKATLTTAMRMAWRGVASAVAAPLTRETELLGVVVMATRRSAHFSAEDMNLFSTVANQVAVALGFSKVLDRLEDTYLETVTALAGAMEAKDQYAAQHPAALAQLAVGVGRKLGLNDDELRRLDYAAALHDIGKIGIAGSVLGKRGELTSEEFAQIAAHTVIGEQIIDSVEYLVPIARIVRSAHERWDGRGYPDGLRGDEIPLASRIIFVCDAFLAMCGDRPYRAALPREDAVRQLHLNAGTQFDPRVVEAFVAVLPALSAATA